MGRRTEEQKAARRRHENERYRDDAEYRERKISFAKNRMKKVSKDPVLADRERRSRQARYRKSYSDPAKRIRISQAASEYQKGVRADPIRGPVFRKKKNARERPLKGRRRVGLYRWEAMWFLAEVQGGKCALCGTSSPRGKWVTDHCHVTGRPRGVLCSNCNTGLGFFRDSAEICGAAEKYLNNPPIFDHAPWDDRLGAVIDKSKNTDPGPVEPEISPQLDLFKPLQPVTASGYAELMFTKDQIELVDETLDELTVELIAVACHQQNRTYCQLLGDDSQPLWLDAPDWQTESAIAGVKHGLVDPNPARSHESWLEQKKADGWVYGEVKDPVAKTHHCMVPYGDLPDAQKRKDTYFIEMVQQLGLVSGLIRINNAGEDK